MLSDDPRGNYTEIVCVGNPQRGFITWAFTKEETKALIKLEGMQLSNNPFHDCDRAS